MLSPLLTGDECRLQDMTKLKNPHKFILMGTPEAQIFIDPADYADKPEVFDDFDLEVTHNSEEWRRAIENSENLAAFTAKTGTIAKVTVHYLSQCTCSACVTA
jgi:hypothetical protein